jgi:phage baseplate assembly protein W
MLNANRPLRLYVDLGFDFLPHPETKDITKKVDINAVKQSLKTLLFTQRGERLFQPDIGSPLYTLMFQLIDPITEETVRVGIENTIQSFEPRVILEQVDIVPSPDENEYQITIFFSVVGIPTPASLSTVITRVR